MNFYQKTGSSNLTGWKLEVCDLNLFSKTSVKNVVFTLRIQTPLR